VNEMTNMILLSIGVLASLVMSLFYGLKLKWFRYRFNLPSTENPILMRTHSVSEIRENCSTGIYRHTINADEILIMTNNSTINAKSKSRKCSIIINLCILSRYLLQQF
jgi:hypothetical protein